MPLSHCLASASITTSIAMANLRFTMMCHAIIEFRMNSSLLQGHHIPYLLRLRKLACKINMDVQVEFTDSSIFYMHRNVILVELMLN